ncbi:glutamate 5-kinase [Persicitalea jodogahamensis]|uniref:Glutamate 5-kinase n=1 Tax=Persicitalea jodogahamensis TaxID=402147 RepID=A0A8J3D8N4_9BACT|nr:glutamate 5-kinase [Persicitalea jodogahamensis]GHB66880.1 glutamate 5-kinase [Persicitalea jodogahamensis]
MPTNKPILVVKFGTASITLPTGEPDEGILAEIARQVAVLHRRYHIIIVSSGAVGAGKGQIQSYKGTLTQRKAAAAVGNPLLIGLYASHFQPHQISIAQSLCERQHFANRHQFLQLKSTFEELWASNIIPIVNENDVVSDRELKFSDNDELATLIATGFGAQTLMLCTSVGGLMDDSGQILRQVSEVNEVFRWVRTDKSSLGLGGMASKLTFTKLATRMGIRVVIFGLNEPDGLLRALQLETGTVFHPQRSTLSARNRWLGSGGLVAGRLRIDDGAVRALQSRHSLLAVGILAVEGEFEAGELVEIFNSEQEMVAVARARATSLAIVDNLKTLNFEVANASDIVLL